MAKSYGEQYRRMMRFFDRLKSLYKGTELPAEETQDGKFRVKMLPDDLILYEETSRDMVYAFFQNCYHFWHWLKNDPSLSIDQDTIKDFMKKNDCLMICSDVCNGSKHLELRAVTGDKNTGLKKVRGVISFDQSQGEAIIKHEYEIVCRGVHYDALQLAECCIDSWHEFMKAHNLSGYRGSNIS